MAFNATGPGSQKLPTPALLSSCKMHLKANAQNVWSDSGRTTRPTSGSAIQLLDDVWSGEAEHADSRGGTDVDWYSSGGPNGSPYLEFTINQSRLGPESGLSSALDLEGTSPRSFYAVWRCEGSALLWIWSKHPQFNDPGWGFLRDSGGKLELYVDGDTTGGGQRMVAESTSFTISPSTWYALIGTYNGGGDASTDVRLFADGVELAVTDSSGIDFSGTALNSSVWTLNGRGDGNVNHSTVCRLAEFAIYDAELNQNELQRLHAYNRAEYNLG